MITLPKTRVSAHSCQDDHGKRLIIMLKNTVPKMIIKKYDHLARIYIYTHSPARWTKKTRCLRGMTILPYQP